LSVSGGGPTATYTWKTVGSVVGTGSSLSVSPGNTTTYQVECTSCGSCTATQVTLTVTPACTLVAAASPTSLVAGSSSTLTVSGGGTAATYSWRSGGSVVGTGSSLTVTPPSTSTYSVACTSCGSCTATQVTVNVSIPPACTLVAVASPASLVAGSGSSTLSVSGGGP
ncbi:hypothetical protein J2I47_26400, partial [Fibrella sp. HMF5335]